MLTNECQQCGNFIEFPEHGVGEEIPCPHCGQSLILTAQSTSIPITSPAPPSSTPPAPKEVASPHLTGAELLRAAGLDPSGRVQQTDSTSARQSARHQLLQPGPVALATLGVLAALGALVWTFLRHSGPASPPEHQDDVNRLEQDALAARAPTGLFGARWLMTSDEVKRVAPNAKAVAPETLSETRPYAERPATITYHFSDDSLLLITVAFAGPSNTDNFAQTQAHLSAHHGPMPAPAAAEGCALSSTKKLGHFVIQHCLTDAGGSGTERIRFWVGKGGDPRNLPKVAPTAVK